MLDDVLSMYHITPKLPVGVMSLYKSIARDEVGIAELIESGRLGDAGIDAGIMPQSSKAGGSSVLKNKLNAFQANNSRTSARKYKTHKNVQYENL